MPSIGISLLPWLQQQVDAQLMPWYHVFRGGFLAHIRHIIIIMAVLAVVLLSYTAHGMVDGFVNFREHLEGRAHIACDFH